MELLREHILTTITMVQKKNLTKCRNKKDMSNDQVGSDKKRQSFFIKGE